MQIPGLYLILGHDRKLQLIILLAEGMLSGARTASWDKPQININEAAYRYIIYTWGLIHNTLSVTPSENQWFIDVIKKLNDRVIELTRKLRPQKETPKQALRDIKSRVT